jgi:hypothetical protein
MSYALVPQSFQGFRAENLGFDSLVRVCALLFISRVQLDHLLVCITDVKDSYYVVV